MKNNGDHAIMMRTYLLCLIRVKNNVNYASKIVRNYLLFPITERTVVASPPRAVLAAPEADPDRLAEAPFDREVPPRTPHSPTHAYDICRMPRLFLFYCGFLFDQFWNSFNFMTLRYKRWVKIYFYLLDPFLHTSFNSRMFGKMQHPNIFYFYCDFLFTQFETFLI